MTASQPPGWRTLPRNVWATAATSFLMDVSSDMLFNLLPLYLASVLGAPTAIIGLIDGIAETTSSLLKGASGWLSDRLGTRKWLAVAGYALSAMTKPLLYFASAWPGVLAVRFLDRAGKGIRTSPRDALIADSITATQRGLAFGIQRAGDTAGAVIGLLIALAVILWLQSGSSTLVGSTFQTLVLISTVPGLLAVLTLLLGARENRQPAGRASPPAAPGSRAALPPRFRAYLLAVGLFTLGNSSDSFIILRAQERGLSVVGVMGMLITFNLVYALTAGPLGALSDRLGRGRLIALGWLTYAGVYLCFALAQSAWQMWAVYVVYGLYYAAFEGTSKAMIADLVPADRRGTAYGAYNMTVGLMALPASLLAGILWQGIGAWGGLGPSAPFLTGALMALAAGLLLRRAIVTNHEPERG